MVSVMIGAIVQKAQTDSINKKNKNALRKALKSLEDFTADNSLITSYGLIAVDDTRKKIVLKQFNSNLNKGKVHLKPIDYSEVQECEIIEDGKSIYKKSNVVGRAVIGGV